MAEDAAAVAEARGILLTGGVEEDARRLEGLGAEHDRARVHFLRLARHAVDVEHAARPVLPRVHEHLVGHGVRHERAVPRLERVGHGGERGVEVRVGHAAALARSTVVTRLPPVDGLRQVRGAAEGHGPPELVLDPGLELPLHAPQAHRRVEPAVGQLVDAFGQPGDPDVVLDEVVVGRDVVVAEGPVVAEAVVGGGLEVDVGEAVALSAPHVRPPAHHLHAALPGERLAARGRVGLFDVVAEPVVVPLRARVAILLDRACAADDLGRAVAVCEVRRGLVLLVVGVGEGPPGVEQTHVHAGLGEALRRPAAGGARAHHDDVERPAGRVLHERPPRGP